MARVLDGSGTQESLEANLARIGISDCKCDHAVRGLGTLHGINMGKGWVRITTHPACPVHALCQGYTKEAEAEYRRTRPWSIGRWCPVHKNRGCPTSTRANNRGRGSAAVPPSAASGGGDV